MNTSQSKVKSWRNCRQQYYYKHIEQIQRRRVRRPLTFGKIVHRMVEYKEQELDPFLALAEADKEQGKLFSSEVEEFGNIIDDIRIIMTDYFDFWKNDDLRFIAVKDETGEYRFAEHEFAVPLADLVQAVSLKKLVKDIIFKGQIDGLGKTSDKLRWLIEHKSFDKMPSDDERWRNYQSVVYVKVAEHLGWLKNIDGIVWNYIHSHAPTIPQLLKDGTRLSRQQISTLPSVVLAVLKKHGLSEKAHEELLANAEQSRRKYFQRIRTPVNRTTADNIFASFVETSIEMRDYEQTRRDKNIGRHCSWCDYELICRTELTGGDVDFVKEREYQPEDPEGYRRTKRSPQLKVVK